jgi:hypothetical protein
MVQRLAISASVLRSLPVLGQHADRGETRLEAQTAKLEEERRTVAGILHPERKRSRDEVAQRRRHERK